MTFQLDTTGTVQATDAVLIAKRRKSVRWDDLTPFAQGYVEAMFASSYDVLPGFMATADQPDPDTLRTRPVGFTDLAPEALARIIADCASFENIASGVGKKTGLHAGRYFWAAQQRGMDSPLGAAFPPLTVTLGDDGKVRLS